MKTWSLPQHVAPTSGVVAGDEDGAQEGLQLLRAPEAAEGAPQQRVLDRPQQLVYHLLRNGRGALDHPAQQRPLRCGGVVVGMGGLGGRRGRPEDRAHYARGTNDDGTERVWTLQSISIHIYL